MHLIICQEYGQTTPITATPAEASATCYSTKPLILQKNLAITAEKRKSKGSVFKSDSVYFFYIYIYISNV